MEGIIESNYFSFEQYKGLVEKYKTEDRREINFQNRIVLPMLDKLLVGDDRNISIVDVSTQYKNRESSIHTRKYYANVHTPDLLIVKNWNYNNKNKLAQDYLAVVEIKSPSLDPINNDNPHTTDEVRDYIDNGSKVILTDCYRWVFYEPKKEPVQFTLHDANGWKLIEVKNDDFLVQQLGFEKTRLESKEWGELIAHIEKMFR